MNTVCIGNDPLCPCQDGDACHYRDTPKTKAFALPVESAADIKLPEPPPRLCAAAIRSKP